MNCIMTFHDTILNISIVTDINIIQDNGILNGTITSNKYFLKDDGVLYSTIDDTSAGDQAILDLCTYILFCRRKIIYLGVDIRILTEEIVSDIRL